MIRIDNLNSRATIFGCTHITPLLISLCGGFYLYENRPDAKQEFIDNLEITNLSIRFSEDYAFYDIIKNGAFDAEVYDFIMTKLKCMSDEDLNICSPYVDVLVSEKSLAIDFH